MPVIRDVDRKGIIEIARRWARCPAKARDGKLVPAEMQGATFTISSLGGIGGTGFTPIVNAPEVAILGVVRSQDGAGVGRQGVRAAPDAAAVAVLRPSRDRRRARGALHPPSLPRARRHAPAGALKRGDIMATVEVKVPDIGDFKNVPVIELHVKAGDKVSAEDPLLTLESDKATMDVPSPRAGTITELKVTVGDTVSEGSIILLLEPEGAAGTPGKETVRQDAAPAAGAARRATARRRRL